MQLYTRDVEAKCNYTWKSLKAFSRVSLQPGEKKEIIFKLNTRDALAIWNREMQHVVEPGEFKIMVGSSSDDIRLNGSIRSKISYMRERISNIIACE